jgi:putative heme-binding domain-containing protein
LERQDRSVVPALVKLAREAELAPGRAHALWTLHGLKALDDDLIEHALKDPVPGVREQALRLAEERLAGSARLRRAVAALADDESPRVRFQLAFTLGEADAPELTAALAKVARRDAADPWTQTAVLSSAGRTAPALLEMLARNRDFTAEATESRLQLLTRLAAVVGRQADDESLARALRLLTERDGEKAQPWQMAVLTGLGQGLQESKTPLSRLWDRPPPVLRETVAKVRPLFEQAAATARDKNRPVAERVAAVRFLGHGPFATAAPALQALLAPQNPAEVHLAAVRSLAQHDNPKVADILLEPWASYSPTVRREVLEALFARPDRLGRLLTAIERKQVLAGQVEPAYLDRLRKHRDPQVRRHAAALLADQATPDRRKVLEEYRAALNLKGDVARGKAVFKKVCATCHRLENEGVEVGPDLLAALANKTPEQLLIDILDPSREVDPRYLNYQVVTRAGRSYTGLIAAETASSLTLRRAEKAEDTILRSDIEVIEATAKSVMPDGLEAQLGKQDLADLIAYLQSAATPAPK